MLGVRGGSVWRQSILAQFLLLMHYTQCEAWFWTCFLSLHSDGEGHVSNDKAGLSLIGHLF